MQERLPGDEARVIMPVMIRTVEDSAHRFSPDSSVGSIWCELADGCVG